MKIFKSSLLLAALLLVASVAQAQFSISKVTPQSASTRAMRDSIQKLSRIDNEFFSEARFRAEKLRIRKERNTVEFNTSLNVNQNAFVNWAPGGDNTFAGAGWLFFKHKYHREKFDMVYSFDTKYGVSLVDADVFKNEDKFVFNAEASWRLKTNWSYAASTNFRSQYSQGFKSRTDQTLVSDFMAPGVWDVSVGFKFQKPKSPFQVTISPIGGSMTFVLNEELSQKGSYGVKKGENTKSTLGSSLRLEYDQPFIKDKFRYRTVFYAFSDYTSDTRARWDNTLEIKATKFLMATFTAALVYDKYAVTPKPQLLQYNYTIGVAFKFQYKNK